MLKLKPYSAPLLAVGGLQLVAMGIYFVFMRPPLLPEDLRYMQTNLSVINNSATGLSSWLQKVFWVMGSYIFTTGLLIIFIAMTSFRTRMKSAFIIVTMAGLTSIGFMTIVNFIINSDFKRMLFAFTLLWLIALILYRSKK